VINGEATTSRLQVTDWSVDASPPVAGCSSFAARHLRPDSAALEVRVRQLVRDAPTNSHARRAFGLHILGTCLNPEGVLETRRLTTHLTSRTLSQAAGATFARCVREYAMKADTKDLETELVELLTGMSYKEVAVRWHEIERLEPTLIKLALKNLRTVYAAVRANNERWVTAPTASEQTELHRIRQALLRQYDNDALMLRVHAFKYSCEGEAIIDEVNQQILSALRSHVSIAEARLFEFLYTRHPVRRRGPAFTGIMGYRTSLISMIEESHNTLGLLVACCHHQRPLRGRKSQIDLELRRQLVGLIRASRYVVSEVRQDESARQAARRVHRPRSIRSSIAATRARAMLPRLEHLSAYQRKVVEALAYGKTVTEIARELEQSHQAVQNALRRSEEKIRALPTA